MKSIDVMKLVVIKEDMVRDGSGTITERGEWILETTQSLELFVANSGFCSRFKIRSD